MSLSLMPPNALVGLITYGKMVTILRNSSSALLQYLTILWVLCSHPFGSSSLTTVWLSKPCLLTLDYATKLDSLDWTKGGSPLDDFYDYCVENMQR